MGYYCHAITILTCLLVFSKYPDSSSIVNISTADAFSFSHNIRTPTTQHRLQTFEIGSSHTLQQSYQLTPELYKTTAGCSYSTKRLITRLYQKGDDKDNDDENDIDISDRDWRAFRAQLVMGDASIGGSNAASEGNSHSGNRNENEETEQNTNVKANDDFSTSSSSSSTIIYDDDLNGIGSLFQDDTSSSSTMAAMSTENFTPLEPSQWAYDAGHVIEKGAVILGGVEQDYGFGLRQQYFHKAVILVLDHDENFTKGIILNRPTDLLLVDENEYKWRIWFGGDVQNLNHAMPEIVCLHTLKGIEEVEEVSTTVMKDIQWCTFEEAKMLVKEGHAQTSDFWSFAGYAGWGPKQLMGELNRKSWYMCATDSQTLLKELAKQSAFTDPRDAGLDTWELLMKLIGRGDTAEECSGDFEDLMLKEWARAHLLSIEAGGSAGVRMQPAEVALTNMDLVQGESIDELMKQAVGAVKAEDVGIGTLLRAAAGTADRSPYLLKDQEFHKSIILVIADDDSMSAGLILNQPSSKAVEMELVDRKSGKSRNLLLPVRFGGQFAIRGQGVAQWLHCSSTLRADKVGSPVGHEDAKIWRCSQDDATSAISSGSAKPSDFLIVSGLSIWIKGERGVYQGLKGEVKNGKFEVISDDKIGQVWESLQSQEALTKMNLLQNLNQGNEAWKAGGKNEDAEGLKDENIPVTSGVGEGFDEEDDALVFKSDVKVAKLSDDALRSWVATFLLGAPTLGA